MGRPARMVAIRVVGFLALFGLGACGGPTERAARPFDPAAGQELDVAASLADSSVLADEATYAGLEKVFPEIPQLETWYREALQAVWNDDLATAEEKSVALDSALTEIDSDENPLASVYFQSLGARVDKLQDLILEQRTLQRYLAKVDSLSVVSPEGVVDSTALSNLLERPVGPKPSSPRYDLKLVENPLTERWVRFFTGDGRHYMALWMTRLPRYRDLMETTLDEYELPRDLVFLAMIESGLSTKAHSVASAVGPWQFIAGTGKLYDLRIDWWVDDRRNFEKSTQAAASHLSDLYEHFGSWPLALAAYNCGTRRVDRAIARHRTRDYWKLTSLPNETRNYVPKFMAAIYIGKEPERYGFEKSSNPRYAYDIVPVEDATDLRLIAELSETGLDEVLELNPHVKRWCTPPGERYDVRVPVGKGAMCAERLAQVPPEERITWRRHRVKKGETLTTLAKNYQTQVQAICDANKLRPTSKLRPGNYLIIPVVDGEQGHTRFATYLTDAAKHAGAPDASVGRSRMHTVRRGDTLSKIGRRYGVSVSKLMKWNGKRSARIKVGERLRVSARGSAD